MRKTWQKPKLVVLVRGRPEEHVLAACKLGSGTEPTNATTINVDCIKNDVFCQDCLAVNGT